MSASREFYLGHPPSSYDGDAASLVRLCVQEPERHGGWTLRPRCYDARASLNVNDFCSSVLQSHGPVLLLQPIRASAIADIRAKLGARVPVEVRTVSTVEELRNEILEVGRAFDNGEPTTALDVVVALLMLRKFDQELMWAGNSKGYMWSDDVGKGRGLDEKYRPRVPHVLNILLQHELVIFKTSNSQRKYALNPERREEIYEILRCRALPPEVDRVLQRNHATESVRALDRLVEYGPPR